MSQCLGHLFSNSQYAETGDAFGEKAIDVKLVRVSSAAFENLPVDK